MLRSVTIFLGLLQTWATRDAIDNDVVSYLDMGDALLQGDWATGVNGMWNPLYGVLLSAVLRITGVSPRHEYAVIHGVVFLIFAATVFAFGFFLRELVAEPDPAAPGAGSAAVTTRSWILLGYVIFTWSSLDVIGVSAGAGVSKSSLSCDRSRQRAEGDFTALRRRCALRPGST